MQHLFYDWDKVKNQIKENDSFLLLDYDGTLTPLRKIPDKAILAVKTRRLIEAISKLDNCKVSLVSGRSVKSLKQLVQFKNLTYIGNHGFQTHDEKCNSNVLLHKDVRYALWNAHKRLYESLSDIKGIIIENKKFTISVHYRMVSPIHLGRIRNTVQEIMRKCVRNDQLSLFDGKNVIEIRPTGVWNKGWAAKKVLSKYNNFLPICIGDDITDEDMFEAFKGIGINIRVGKCADSKAEYYVDNVSEVQHFLNCVFDLKNKNTGS
jgi:trehalose 6-phosphate phosphatase